MISKFEGALQELEETRYWLELLEESEIVDKKSVAKVVDESGQLIAILTASVRTIKDKR
jgi:four helix bundle protein